jgi:hypothetical protein
MASSVFKMQIKIGLGMSAFLYLVPFVAAQRSIAQTFEVFLHFFAFAVAWARSDEHADLKNSIKRASDMVKDTEEVRELNVILLNAYKMRAKSAGSLVIKLYHDVT